MEGVSRTIGSTGKPLLKNTSEMQKPPEQDTIVLSHFKSLTLTCVYLNCLK